MSKIPEIPVEQNNQGKYPALNKSRDYSPYLYYFVSSARTIDDTMLGVLVSKYRGHHQLTGVIRRSDLPKYLEEKALFCIEREYRSAVRIYQIQDGKVVFIKEDYPENNSFKLLR